MHIYNEFSIDTSEQVSSFCQPFLQEFKLTSFNYARIYSDESLLALHSHPIFAKLYIELNTPPIVPIPDLYWQFKSFYFLAKTCNKKSYINLLKKSTILLDSDNPLYLINQQQKYTEIAVFCSSFSDTDVINRYFNHLKDLSFFVSNFSENCADYMEKKCQKRLTLPPHLCPQIPKVGCHTEYPSCYDDFYKQMLIKKILPTPNLKKLTSREIQCLYYLSRGYSYKAIAIELQISSRTVETHLINAKNKLNITLTSTLISILSKI